MTAIALFQKCLNGINCVCPLGGANFTVFFAFSPILVEERLMVLQNIVA